MFLNVDGTKRRVPINEAAIRPARRCTASHRRCCCGPSSSERSSQPRRMSRARASSRTSPRSAPSPTRSRFNRRSSFRGGPRRSSSQGFREFSTSFGSRSRTLPIRMRPTAALPGSISRPEAAEALASLRDDVKTDIDRLRQSSDGLVPDAVLDGLANCDRASAGADGTPAARRRQAPRGRRDASARHGARIALSAWRETGAEVGVRSIPRPLRPGVARPHAVEAQGARDASLSRADGPLAIAGRRSRVGMTAVPRDSAAQTVELSRRRNAGERHTSLWASSCRGCSASCDNR